MKKTLKKFGTIFTLLRQAFEVAVGGGILSMVCIRDELMVSTTRGHILRYRWDATQNRDYCLDLRRIPFCIDQQVSKGNNNSDIV